MCVGFREVSTLEVIIPFRVPRVGLKSRPKHIRMSLFLGFPISAGWMDGRIDGRTDGWMDARIDRQIDRSIDGN